MRRDLFAIDRERIAVGAAIVVMQNGWRFRQYTWLRFTHFEYTISPPRKVDGFATDQLGEESYGNKEHVELCYVTRDCWHSVRLTKSAPCPQL